MTPKRLRRRRAVAVLAAAALPVITLTAAAVPAPPAAATPAPPGSGPARQYGARTQVGTCGLTAGGRRSPCPRPLPPGRLPPRTRDLAPVAARARHCGPAAPRRPAPGE